MLTIVGQLFEQRGSDSEDDAADELAARCFGTEDFAAIEDTDYSRDADATYPWIYGDFNEVSAEGLKGIILVLPENRLRISKTFDKDLRPALSKSP